VEAAELFGVPPAVFLSEIAVRSGFPEPVFAVEHRRIWRLADLEAYRTGPACGAA
jgi:hypothetical protein